MPSVPVCFGIYVIRKHSHFGASLGCSTLELAIQKESRWTEALLQVQAKLGKSTRRTFASEQLRTVTSAISPLFNSLDTLNY